MLTLEQVVQEIKYAEKYFYVYMLYKPNGTSFYVGKGKVQIKDQRVCYHEQEARSSGSWKRQPHLNRLKINTIRKIWEQNKQVQYLIDSWHDTEESAYERETYLIRSIGRRIVSTGPLTNITEGGEKEMATIPQQTRDSISSSLKTYYKNNPDRLEAIKQQANEYFSKPEAREKARQNAIKNNSAENIIKWLKDKPEQVAERNKKLSFIRKQWNIDNPERAKEIVTNRNEILRSQKHREHMAAATTKYIRENPEADKLRRAKVQKLSQEKTEIRQECLKFLFGKEMSQQQLHILRKNAKLPEDFPRSQAKIEIWKNYRDELFMENIKE